MKKNKNEDEKIIVPIWHKSNLSIEEASAYTGISRKKIYELINKEERPFVLRVGNRRLIKREAFDEYIKKAKSI